MRGNIFELASCSVSSKSKIQIFDNYFALIKVPTPSSVNTSNKSACCTLPSIMWTLLTPPLAASSAELILGSIPPDKVPSSTSLSI